MDDAVKGLLLIKEEAESGSCVFSRIGFFERGKNVEFQSDTNTEVSII
jgi:hypothetical protein